MPDHPGPAITPDESPESVYLRLSSAGHRRSLGQVFTPEAVAEWMATWAVQPGCRSVLDPALGAGIFLRHAARRARGEPTVRWVGYEVDADMRAFFLTHGQMPGGNAVELRPHDFVTAPESELFDAVLCNPPYLKRHQFKYSEAVFQEYEQRFQIRLSRMANTYALFLLRISGCLSPHGRAAVLTPVEYLNANFGVALKAYLLRENLLDGLVLFDAGLPLFEGATTTGCLTLLRRGRNAGEPVHIAHVTHLSDLRALQWETVSPATFDPRRKWAPESRLLAGKSCLSPPIVSARSGFGRRLVPLAEYVEVDRGIATGANGYFSLSAGEVAAAGLDLEHIQPCLTKSHHAPGGEFTLADWERLRQDGKKVYLLDTSGPCTPALERYLAHGEALGISRRYLPSHRQPWHRMEKRRPADILVTVFSRNGFRFIRNRAGVLNLTAFHCLYLRPGVSQEMAVALMAYLTSAQATPQILAHCRQYGDGLKKLEPNDIGQILAPDIRTTHPYS